MNNSALGRLLVGALLLIAGPAAFGQLQDREVTAGAPYEELFKVLCLVGGPDTTISIGQVDLRVQVRPPAFILSAEPMRVSVGSLFKLSSRDSANPKLPGNVPITTPSGRYEVTLIGIGASAAACPSTNENFNIFVRKPVELSVAEAPIQIVTPGTTSEFGVRIRRRTGFEGPVRLRAAGLPFATTFDPPAPTGNNSILKVQVPATTTQCLPPDGCRVQIQGDASVPEGRVEVQSADFRLVVLGQVSLTPDRTAAMVEAGREAVFKLRVNRIGYAGPVDLAVTPIEQPANGKFTTRIDPPTLTSEPEFTLGITIDRGAPGQYKFRVQPANTGQEEIPLTLEVQPTGMSLITVTPETQTVNLGDPAEYTVMKAEQVMLTGVEVSRAGLFGELSPAGDKLIVQTRPTTPTGTYQLFVTGSVPAENGGTQTIEARPVTLNVQAAPNGSISITAPTGVRSIPPGFRSRFSIDVDPINDYAGVVTLLVPEILAEGVTASFEGGNTVELNGIGKTKTLILETPENARPTGEITVLINSESIPDAPRNVPSIRFMVTEPQLTFSNIFPPPGAGIVSRGGFNIKAKVNRNGCQSPFSFDYTPRTMFEIDLPPNMDLDTFARAIVTKGTFFDLTVKVMADGCLPDSFTLSGTIEPLPTIPPLVTATLAPSGQTIQRGQSAAYNLTVNRGDTQGPIAIAVSGLPAGVTSTVVPNPITGSTAQVMLNTTSSTPTGTFTFTVTASSNGNPIATATAGLVIVATGGTALPTISSFTPASGTPGTPVQITGTNFVGVQSVRFNGTGTPFATISPTQINTTVPGFATTGPISVLTAGGLATSSTPFVVGSSPLTPQITSFSPTSGAAGTSVRLNGVNLGGVIDVTMGTPAFGFNPIPFTPFDPTRIDVIIPPGAFSGFFRVMTLSGTATSGTAFNVTTPNLPEIGGFDPISGTAGTRVQIIGSNLAGATQVTFAGVNASFEPPTQNSIFATVPPGAMTGQIRVTTPAGTATSFSSFAVTSGGPVITDFQPQSGQVGFSVTIAGVNLSGTSQVTFNGKPASIGIITANFVQVFVPPGATTGPIRLVTPNGEATSSTPFTVVP